MSEDEKPNLGNEHEMSRAIGSALAWWNNLEDSLGHVFCAAFGGVNHPVARTAYLSANNFTPRFNMVQAVMRSAQLDEATLTKWEALRKRLKDKSEIRNKLTHFSRVSMKDKNGDPIIFVVPNFWKAEEFGKATMGKGTRWNWIEVAQFGQEFGSLSIELDIFAWEVEAYLEERPIRYYRKVSGLRLHGVLPPSENGETGFSDLTP